mgnify:CR=1 FL=1
MIPLQYPKLYGTIMEHVWIAIKFQLFLCIIDKTIKYRICAYRSGHEPVKYIYQKSGANLGEKVIN